MSNHTIDITPFTESFSLSYPNLTPQKEAPASVSQSENIKTHTKPPIKTVQNPIIVYVNAFFETHPFFRFYSEYSEIRVSVHTENTA